MCFGYLGDLSFTSYVLCPVLSHHNTRTVLSHAQLGTAQRVHSKL